MTALGALAASPLALLAAARETPGAHTSAPSAFGFTEVAHGVNETHQIAPCYRADILVRWGDPVLPGAPIFDPRGQSVAAQLRQFRYNNDYIGFLPLPFGSGNSDHGLLRINREYTNEEVMFP